MSARESIENLWDRATPIGPLLDAYAHELAEKQRAWAEEEWTGGDARMILRRRVARHLADLIDPEVTSG